MNVCYFGDFDPEYSRNRVLLKGLRQNGVAITLIHTREKGWRQFFALARAHRAVKGTYDVLVVGYSDSRLMVPFAKLLTRKPIVWDAFYSLYDSWIYDRKLARAYSVKALWYWMIERFSAGISDLILLDTDAHINYFVNTFGIPRSRCVRVWVGTDDELFFPQDSNRKTENKLTVHFHGRFIPLQGVSYILKAASLLKGKAILFRIIGRGQEYERARELAKQYDLDNVEWIDQVPYSELLKQLAQADIVFGIFGDTPKAQRVIPNKVYEAVAMGKPVISSDTPAIRELFTHRENIFLCPAASGEELARSIVELQGDHSLRERIGAGGRAIFEQYALPRLIGKTVFEHLDKLTNTTKGRLQE